MKRIVPLVLLLSFACSRKTEAPKFDENAEIMKWRQNRLTRLKSDDGWLTLVGLQWLNDGENKIQIPPNSGSVVLQNGLVMLMPSKTLTIDGKPVTAPVALHDDTDAKGPTVVSSGTTHFYVVKRAPKYALRVKDTSSPARTHFLGLDYFPVAPQWRVEAHFEPFNPPHHVTITNVLGMTSDEIAPGLLAFTVNGKEYKLEPILEQGETDYFIIFKDATSGKETYAAARYVYAHPPDKNGMTVIDFNKAYNPPCAFTQFATCPLPPPQNRLPFRIEAGELKYRGHH
ncbi:MAG TPA: DUF1684 domain-containing protein [Thermoanaerobaculia bacterium]|nr:DUF1684 domain-containing protein [Thermoanaerobaculia bacterium]